MIMELPGNEINEKPRKSRRFKIIVTVIIIAAAAAAVLGGIYLWYCNKAREDIIHTKTTINGIDITGMSRAQAAEAVQKDFEEKYGESKYIVKAEGKTLEIPIFKYLSVDASAEIEKAYEAGHGDFLKAGFEYLDAQNQKQKADRTVEPVLGDTSKIGEMVDKFCDSMYSPGSSGEWEFNEKDGKVYITMGVPERSVNADAVKKEIADGLKNAEYSGTVTRSFDVKEPLQVDPGEIEKAMKIEPKDAEYYIKDGKLEVTKEAAGRKLSADDVKKKMEGKKEGEVFTMDPSAVQPKVKAEELKAKLLKDVISEYQVIDGGSPSQLTNQGLACAAVNGKILMPGEEFSFNELVGDTTPDKGYVEDYAYLNGNLIKEYGGGICRVASTLYAAVLNSSLEVTLRYNHSSPVHYLPLGMDATVSYPIPDLRFVNNRDYPIKIEMWLSDGYVHSKITGTAEDTDCRVEAEVEQISEWIYDTYRNHYDKNTGELVLREFMHTSQYKPLN